MPNANWLKGVTAEKAQDFLITPLDEMHGAPKHVAVKVDADYVTLRIKAARTVDVRRWTSRFHGCMNSRARLLHEGGGSVEHQTVLAPPELKEVDPANIDRIVSIDKGAARHPPISRLASVGTRSGLVRHWRSNWSSRFPASMKRTEINNCRRRTARSLSGSLGDSSPQPFPEFRAPDLYS